jgi:hypothetical protein
METLANKHGIAGMKGLVFFFSLIDATAQVLHGARDLCGHVPGGDSFRRDPRE